jgi:hypothetical protein
MYKVAFFRGETDAGPVVYTLHGKHDVPFEKVAAPTLLDEVSRYIASLRPRNDAQYVLVNAMGAGEFYSSNVNGDAFPEAALIHAPDDWTHNPIVDRIKAKDWAYGYPTFYSAHPYAHHRNKDAERAFGEVELAAWNARMHRVELVVRVDKDRCQRFGGIPVWDKLHAGQFPDVSMGARVPFDTCSICLDWGAYRKGQATFDPKAHKSPGEAVLAYHRALKVRNGHGIRGLSITRKDYCEHALKQMNRILPDGRKVFVYNDYPRFFDISFVFVGADKTAKVMLKIASESRVWSLPSAELAEKLGYDEADEALRPVFVGQEKQAASRVEDPLKVAFLGKAAKSKAGEMVKDVLPNPYAVKAVPFLTSREEDLPDSALDLMARRPLEESLSTSAGLGILLRPREFQHLVLRSHGLRELADELREADVTFPRVDSPEGTSELSVERFSSALARALLPLLASRSAFGPAIEHRLIVVASIPQTTHGRRSSLSSDLLRKMGAAYSSYRQGAMNVLANAQELLSAATPLSGSYIHKLASSRPDEIFTPLSVAYCQNAFWDEVDSEQSKTAFAGVERGLPSRNTFMTRDSGGQKS